MADGRRAWANALFRALTDEDSRDRAAIALERLAEALGGEGEAFFLDPAVPMASRTEVLASLFEGGKPESARLFARFADLLVEKRRVLLVPAIAVVFRSILDRERGIVRMDIVSARALSQPSLDGIGKAWKKALGARDVVIRVSQDPALLGGFILRTGSVRYDWSTAGRLKRLRQELSRPLETGRD